MDPFLEKTNKIIKGWIIFSIAIIVIWGVLSFTLWTFIWWVDIPVMIMFAILGYKGYKDFSNRRYKYSEALEFLKKHTNEEK